MAWLDALVPAQYRAAIADAFLSPDNPISVRDHRRFARRGEPWLFMGVVLGVTLGGVELVFGVVIFIQQQNVRVHGVPPLLGGSYGTLLAVAASAFRVWLVWVSAQRWCTRFFLTEYRQNTLQPLVMTPTPPFALVAQASARPMRLGLLAAAVGLPFYALAMACGGIGWLDLLGLYILFAMLSAQVPSWQIPLFSGMALDLAKRANQVRRPTTWGEMWLRMGPAYLMIFQGPLTAVLGHGWAFSLVVPLWQEVPHDIQRIAPVFPLTWALAFSRLMLASLPFFAFSLPMVILLVPMRIVGRVMRIWEVSVYLRIEDIAEMAGLSDMKAYWRLRSIYAAAAVLAAIGYAWQPFVVQRRTAYLLGPFGGGDGQALAGLVWLLGAWAVLDTWGRMRTGAAIERAARLRGEALPDGLRGRVRAFALNCLPASRAVAIYAIACCLGLRWLAPREAIVLALQLGAVGLAGGLWVRSFAGNGWLYAGMLLLPLLGWAAPEPNMGAWIAACSPVAGILSFTYHTGRLVHELLPAAQVPTWWMCCCASLGCAAASMLRFLLPQRKTGVVPRAKDEALPMPARVFLGAPTTTAISMATSGGLHRPPSADEQPPEDRVAAAARTGVVTRPKREYPAGQRLLAAITRRTDNPLTVKEARVLMRGHLGRAELITYAMVLVLPISLFVRYYSDLREFLEGIGSLYFGSMGIQDAGLLAGHAGLWATLLGFLVPMVAMNPCAATFVREREKSTLAFVLCTPLKTRQVVLGKIWGATMPAWMCWLIGAAWIVLTSLPVAAGLGPGRWLVGLAIALLLPLALAALIATLGLYLGTFIRKENDAAGLALLALLVLATAGAFGAYTACGAMDWRVGGPGMPALAPFAASQVLLALLLSPVFLALTLWRVERARHRDISTEGSVKPA